MIAFASTVRFHNTSSVRRAFVQRRRGAQEQVAAGVGEDRWHGVVDRPPAGTGGERFLVGSMPKRAGGRAASAVARRSSTTSVPSSARDRTASARARSGSRGSCERARSDQRLRFGTIDLVDTRGRGRRFVGGELEVGADRAGPHETRAVDRGQSVAYAPK